MQRFTSARHAQRFLSAHSRIHNHVQLRRHRLTAHQHRSACDAAFCTWRDIGGVCPPGEGLISRKPSSSPQP
jgi:putative transposase